MWKIGVFMGNIIKRIYNKCTLNDTWCFASINNVTSVSNGSYTVHRTRTGTWTGTGNDGFPIMPRTVHTTRGHGQQQGQGAIVFYVHPGPGLCPSPVQCVWVIRTNASTPWISIHLFLRQWLRLIIEMILQSPLLSDT